MDILRNFKLLALPCLAAMLGLGCVSNDPRVADRSTLYLNSDGTSARTGAPPHDNVSFWDGDGVAGSPRMVIRLSEQRVYFYKGEHLVGVSMISTGREGYNTPTGNYSVLDKRKDHRSSLYGDYVDAAGNVVVKDVDSRKDSRPPGTTYLGASMPYFMRITGGVGLHAGFLPGYPASHGCIRMPEFMAENFFYNVSPGTPVTVTH